jgi:uncharacterized DUF497 family protein
MDFEYDTEKSARNAEKHGIDFEQAQALWGDDDAIEIPANSKDESRFAVMGKLRGRHWVAFVTYRGESIRIISVRRARRNEVEWYEKNQRGRIG